MKLTFTNYEQYLRHHISGLVTKKWEDWVIKVIKRLLRYQKIQLERSFKNDKGKQGKLV